MVVPSIPFRWLAGRRKRTPDGWRDGNYAYAVADGNKPHTLPEYVFVVRGVF